MRAIRLGLPRSEAVQALVWLLSLVSNAEVTAGAVDGDGVNLYEAFALAAILGAGAGLTQPAINASGTANTWCGAADSPRAVAGVRAGDRRLMELVSMQLVDHINAHNVVLCGALAVEYGHPGLLEHCYYWLAAHIVSTARLVPGFFGVPSDANLIPGIEGNEFVHKFFHLNQAVFHDISSTLTERRIPFITYAPRLPRHFVADERQPDAHAQPLVRRSVRDRPGRRRTARCTGWCASGRPARSPCSCSSNRTPRMSRWRRGTTSRSASTSSAEPATSACKTRTTWAASGARRASAWVAPVGGAPHRAVCRSCASAAACRCNLTGTVFTVFDHGQPSRPGTPVAMGSVLPPRKELGIVLYERNILGWEPREFQVALPVYAPTRAPAAALLGRTLTVARRAGAPTRERSSAPLDTSQNPSLADQWAAARFSGLIHIKNRAPKWNEGTGTHARWRRPG